MSNARNTGFLTNVIKVDASGNVSFVSGSTTLATISTSGQMSGSAPALSSSYALSASYATNAETLDGLDSTAFATTGAYGATSGSLYTVSASPYLTSGSLSSASGSFNSRISTVESKYATTGSNTFTSPQHVTDLTVATGFANTSASIYADGGLLISKDAYFSGSMFIKGDLTIYGTQSIAYITSSQLNISTNLITVNTATPSVRFGGLAVYDSGSTGTGMTGSLLWDSQNNSWIYDNPSGSGNYDSAMVIMGPRNASSLGSEQGLTCNYLVQGHGHHHTTSSLIYHNSTVTCIPNTLIAGGCIGVGTSTPCSILHVYGSNPSLIVQNSAAASVGNTANIFFRNLLSTGAIHYAGYIAGIQQSTSANTGDLSFNTYNNGSVVEGMRIASSGNIGMGSTSPSYQLDMCSGTTVNQRIRLQRGSDDTNQNMLLGWNSIVVTRSNVSISGNQTDFSIIQCGSDGARVPFNIGVGGQAYFTCQVCTPSYNFVGAPNSCIIADASYTKFITSNATRFDIDVSGIATFACRVCVNTLTLGLNANSIFTKSNGSTYCRFLYAGSNLHVLFPGGTTANNGALGVNNFEDTDRIFNMLNNGVSTFTNTVCSPKFWSTGDVNAAGTANAKYFRDYYIGNVYSTFAQHANPNPGTYQAFCASQGAVLYITSMHNNGRSTTIVNYTNGVTGGMAFTVVNQTSAYSPANITISAGGSGWLCIYYPYGGPTDFMAQVMGGTHTWGSSLTS